MENTTYLSCSGGGTKGLIYVGVLDALEDHMDKLGKSYYQWRSSLKGLSGTSAGCVCCLLVLLGFDKFQRSRLVKNIFCDMRNIVPCPDITLMATSYGLENGTTFKKQIQDMLNISGLSPETTLGDIKRLFGKEFVCVCSDLQRQKPIYLSSTETPQIKVYDAVYMSCSIPFVFAPMKYNGNYMIDGSMTEDVPLIFDKDLTLFLVISKTNEKEQVHSWPEYIYCLLKFPLSFQKNKELIKDNICVTIEENEYAMSKPPFDLQMTEETIEKFASLGYITMLNAITSNQISIKMGTFVYILLELIQAMHMD